LADEVMQEAYLKVWKMAVKFDPTIASPITWMVAIARNRAIDIVRKKGELSIEDEPDALNVAAETPPPLARREMTEELKKLLSCLGKLDPEKQRIVLLAYYSGWSRDQLAKKLDIPVNTIKTWLRRSLLEIRACMGT
jgi:RNA polymerase sigma-70 factor (ECF subfamily)